MIANVTELKVAARNLKIVEQALAALREQLQMANPRLLEISSEAYVRRIASLQGDIAQYLAGHPSDISLILAPLDQAVTASSVSPAPTSVP